MSTYSAWWKGFLKKPEPRMVTWLCGPERVLVDDALKTIRRRLMPTDWNYVPLALGEDSEREVWAEVFAVPMGEAAVRLVVVRNAERLKQPERLLQFVKRADAHPGVYVVFVSNEPGVPRLEPTEDQRFARSKGDVVPWLLLGTKIHTVECRPWTADTAKVAVEWVTTKTGMRANVAGYLLNRADGNMRLVRDVCLKLASFGQDITISAINDLLSAQPRDTLVNCLVAMNKKGALTALDRMVADDYSRTIGLLDSQLDLAGMVHDMTVAHHTLFEIQRAAGNKNFLVKDLMDVARHYDAKRRASIRSTLAVADDALRSGSRIGVLEAVIALW